MPAVSDLAEHVWDENFDPFSKVIEVFIQRLRRKIDSGQSIKLIHTRRGEAIDDEKAFRIITGAAKNSEKADFKL